MLQTSEDWFFALMGVLMLPTFVSWLVFGRMTMARIERELRVQGVARPCQWDGPGFRIVCYAWAIAFPVGLFNLKNDPLIDVPLVRTHATRADWFRATTMVVLSVAMTAIGLVGVWYFDIQ